MRTASWNRAIFSSNHWAASTDSSPSRDLSFPSLSPFCPAVTSPVLALLAGCALGEMRVQGPIWTPVTEFPSFCGIGPWALSDV